MRKLNETFTHWMFWQYRPKADGSVLWVNDFLKLRCRVLEKDLGRKSFKYVNKYLNAIRKQQKLCGY